MHFILRGPVRRLVVAALVAATTHAVAAPIGYSVRSDVDRKLYRIDMATGVATEVGATGFSKIEGLAINSAGEIFGVNPSSAQLVKCNAATGACTAVGTLTGLPQLQENAGLAFASNGSLYLGMNAVVYRVDPATAATAPLGSSGPALSGLAGVAPTEACPSGLFGMGGNSDRGKFYCINVVTGVATLLTTLGIAPLDVGLDGDPVTGLVWGVTNDASGQVFAVDPVTVNVSNVNTVTLAGKAIGGFESLAIARTGTTAVGDPIVLPVAELAVGVPALNQSMLLLLLLLIPAITPSSRAVLRR